MILENELNIVYDLGSLSLYDTNPRTVEQLENEDSIKKIVNENLTKLKSLLINHKKETELDQEVRPLAAKVIDFNKGI